MKKLFVLAVKLLTISVLFVNTAFSQLGLNDQRVLLQGFYWESYRFGHTTQFPKITKHDDNQSKYWYEIVKEKAPEINEGRFDMIWLPPPSQANGGAGYSPVEYFNLNNMYGDSAKHRAMLEELWKQGVEPIADIVINHRNGANSWAQFKNPAWGAKSICATDEAFSNCGSEVYNTPIRKRGNDEEEVCSYDKSRGRAFAYESFRDIDHTDPLVRKDIMRFLLLLKSYGYLGWRYDMVHGFHARHIASYNKVSKPTFSVGEYDWDKQPAWRGWIWNSSVSALGAGNERIRTSSAVFDFTTHFSLQECIGSGCNHKPNYKNLYAYGNGLGLMGDNTDSIAWKNKAVTFVDNHDTGWRTTESLTNEKDHDFDSFSNDWEVEQAYAYILTHPGVPCVFWKHYFDWGTDLKDKIKALINARKVAGVSAGSNIHTQQNAKDAGVYAAMVEGIHGRLFVRIGGDDNSWNPSKSNYTGYREYAAGNGWKVWVVLNDLNKNSTYQIFPLKASLGTIPAIKKVAEIVVPNN